MTAMELPAGVGWAALLTAYGQARELRDAER
jgi:hypothetical protein